jgi:hypothetical protein
MHTIHRIRNTLRIDGHEPISWWPEWTEEAECRNYPPEWFYDYGRNKRKIERAKWVCQHCPVISQCLRDNLMVPDGIFAGMTWLERWRYQNNTGYPPRHNAFQFFEGPYSVFASTFSLVGKRKASRQKTQPAS